MTLTVNTKYSTYPDCFVVVHQYQYDGSTCIKIINRAGEAIAYLTTCIPNCSDRLKNDESFVDSNNSPWALDFIKKYKLGTVSEDRSGFSGFCVYPIVKWDFEEIKKYAPEE